MYVVKDLPCYVEDSPLQQEVDELKEHGVAVLAGEALVHRLLLGPVDDLDFEFNSFGSEIARDGALGWQDAQVAHLLHLCDGKVLAGHLTPIFVLVNQAKEQVCVRVRPVVVQDVVEMFSSLMVVLSLDHERCKEKPRLVVQLSAAALDCLVHALLCLYLKVVAEAELSELLPLFVISGLVHQVVHKVFLRALNVTNRVELKSKTVKSLGDSLPVALVEFVVTGPLNVLELGHNVGVKTVPVRRQDGLLQARLHLRLQEDVQLGLELVLLFRSERLGPRLFLDHFSTEAEDGLLEPVAQLLILRQLGELSQELLAPLVR